MSSEMFKLSKPQEERAAELHAKATVVDALSLSYTLEKKYLKRLKQGGVKVALISIGGTNARTAINVVNTKYAQIEDQSDQVALTLTIPDMEETIAKGKIAVFFGTQNCVIIEDDLDLLRLFYKMGLRSFGPTYSFGNLLGAGCIERFDYGLTYFGVDVIAEVSKLNCLVDVAHCGDAVTNEAIDLAKYPVATHANARTLSQTTRNKTDEQIKAIAEKDGVIGAVAAPGFVSQPNPAAARKRWPNTDDYLDHIDYMINLVGVDHVGMGLDQIEKHKEEGMLQVLNTRDRFGMYRQRTLPGPQTQFGTLEDAATIPYAIPSVANLPDVTRGLVARGYSDQDILKILGNNWIRIFKKILR